MDPYYQSDLCDSIPKLSDFWDAIRPWLAAKGVNLYTLGIPKSQRSSANPWKHWYTPLVSNTAPLPYAKCVDMEIRLACAQDDVGRDLMLKLVDKDSDQYRIYKRLLQNWDLFCDPRTFPCVLPPVDILDTPHNYSIVTMPMWGDYIEFKDMSTVGEVLRFMQCLLDGLVFLHSRRIAHRDICDFNIVANCYRLDRDRGRLAQDLCQHRASNVVFYALMDYDQSIQLPNDASLKHCRRSSEEAWAGAEMYKPADVMLGEPEYNPFAFDVAMLGNLFRVQFPQAVVAVPALAALYDNMTTHVIPERFTAVEARQFLEDETSYSPHDMPLNLCPDWNAMMDADVYWSNLPTEVQQRWSRFRTPPLSLRLRMLEWLMGYPTCCEIIVFVRRVLRI
ncbi:hypothetical protein C8Q80DRAFT_1220561 [Daedaleopsis nitida]|nr:hypothetical protein C8Q80DRAFT_1220561 [Daedaleopsis nitida]